MKERWKNFPNKGPLLALSCGHATVDSYAAFLASLLPLLRTRFDLSLAAVGVLIFVVGFGAVAQPLYGFIADRSERRTFLIWGPVLAAVFTCMIGWAPNRAVFVACLIMAHVGINAYHPQAAATVSRIGGARRGLAMGLFMNSGAVGFALGMERILSLLEAQQEQKADTVDVYLVLLGEASELKGLQLAEDIREQAPDVKMITHCGGGSMKSQLKKADKSGADIAVILGEDELDNKQVTIKYLREKKDQKTISFEELAVFITAAQSK